MAAALLLTTGPSFALADNGFSVLQEPAITIVHPDRALLISIARAGDRLVAVGAHGAIIYSDDNGVVWRQAAVPVSIVITSVAFATPKIGWACGDLGVVLHTADGGASWQVQLTGDKVLALMTRTASQLAAAKPEDPTAVRALRRAGILAASGPNKPFLEVIALSPEKAIVLGAYRMAVATDDGGRSWSDISLHIGDPLSHNLYSAAWVGDSLFLAGEAGALLRSDDQGQSFQMLDEPTQSTFLGVMDAGGGVVFAYGVAGNAYRSVDHGKSWLAVSIPSSSDLTSAVMLPSGKIFVATEDGNIFESTDHAKTFSAVAGNQNMELFGLASAANGAVAFVGTGGVHVVPASLLAQ